MGVQPAELRITLRGRRTVFIRLKIVIRRLERVERLFAPFVPVAGDKGLGCRGQRRLGDLLHIFVVIIQGIGRSVLTRADQCGFAVYGDDRHIDGLAGFGERNRAAPE